MKNTKYLIEAFLLAWANISCYLHLPHVPQGSILGLILFFRYLRYLGAIILTPLLLYRSQTPKYTFL